MRLVEVYALEQWTGKKDSLCWLEVPQALDLKPCEDAWFKAGGDSSGETFADYLIRLHGCRRAAEPEAWCINYM